MSQITWGKAKIFILASRIFFIAKTYKVIRKWKMNGEMQLCLKREISHAKKNEEKIRESVLILLDQRGKKKR